MLNKLEKWLMPLAEAIGRNKYLMSVRDGFLISTPLLIAGSIFLVIANFPIPAWMDWLSSVIVNKETGETLAAFLAKLLTQPLPSWRSSLLWELGIHLRKT